jgi:hypothetical protein
MATIMNMVGPREHVTAMHRYKVLVGHGDGHEDSCVLASFWVPRAQALPAKPEGARRAHNVTSSTDERQGQQEPTHEHRPPIRKCGNCAVSAPSFSPLASRPRSLVTKHGA